MGTKIMEFFKNLDEYRRLKDYEEYLVSLISLAERSLDLDELKLLTPYIRELINKTVELRKEKIEVEMKIKESSPEYRKIISSIVRVIDEVLDLNKLLNRLRNGTLKELSFISNKLNIDNIKTVLNKSLDELENLKKREEFEKYISVINEEISKIKTVLKKIDSLRNILSPSIDSVKESWKYLNYKVYVGDKLVGFVNNVSYTIPDLDIVFEVFTEDTLSDEDLRTIYENLYREVIVSEPYEEFKGNILREIKEILYNISISDIYRPTILKKYFRIKGIKLNKDVEALLDTKVKYVGFFFRKDASKIDSINKAIYLHSKDALRKNVDRIRALSYAKIDRELINKVVYLDDEFRYVIYWVTWLHDLGATAILLRLDELKNPVPDIRFVKKILLFLETKKEDTKRENRVGSGQDLYWKLKLLVLRTLTDYREITESKSLQPKYLYEFILRKRIPILYPELHQKYFVAIPLILLKKTRKFLVSKVYTQPLDLRNIFSEENVKLILGDRCNEYLGVIVKRGEGVKFLCCEKFSKIVDRVKSEFDVDEKILRLAENDLKKLLRSLIIAGYIKSRDDYNKLMNILNIKEISYEKLIEPILEDELTLTQIYLLKSLREKIVY